MVGDDHLDSEPARRLDALDAGDSVVHRDEELRLRSCRERDDFRGQPVAELESVGDEIADVRAEGGERAHAHRAGGRPVAIVVGDDQHALAGRDRVREQRGRAVRVQQTGGRDKAGKRVLELAAPYDPARRADAREHRMQAFAHELVVHAQGNRAGGDLGHQLCIGGKGLAQPPEIAEVRTHGLDLQEPILSAKVQRDHPDPA